MPLSARQRKARDEAIHDRVVAQANFYRSTLAEFVPREYDPWAALSVGLTRATEAERGTCFFMKLPSEIRIIVYEYVLTKKDTIVISRREQRLHRGPMPALFRVSSTIRREAMAVYFKCNKFHIKTRLEDFERLAIWFRQLLDERAVIKFGKLQFVVCGLITAWKLVPKISPLVKLIAAGRLQIDITAIELRAKKKDPQHAKKSSLFLMQPRIGTGYIQLALEEAAFLAPQAQSENWYANKVVNEFGALGLKESREGLWWQKCRQRLKTADVHDTGDANSATQEVKKKARSR